MSNWSIDSWKNFPIKQQPKYNDEQALNAVLNDLKSYPSLVIPAEVDSLKKKLAKVAKGEAFLLQGGDCAESFAEFNQNNLESYFKVILQMTVALMYGAGKPVVKVGRVAGQFAKPRSADFEEQDGKSLPSYRGDIINSIDFVEESRQNNPENLRKAYLQSAATLNYLRGLATSGYSSIKYVNQLNNNFVKNSSQGKRFEEIVQRINDANEFMKACGVDAKRLAEFSEAEFFVSHEGLLLPYEAAFTQRSEANGKYYALSAHLLWIGERTRELDEAHIEFFRGITNPIASKISQKAKPDDVIKLIDALNPNNEPGRLTLISRMGKDNVGEYLPALVRKVKEEGRHVIWSCDPMHGNTIKSPNGYKTRPFNDILGEVKNFFAVHESEGTYAGGVHFEMTGQDVTECIGGSQAITEVDLDKRYHTHCDPRLNASQSLELAFLIAEELRG